MLRQDIAAILSRDRVLESGSKHPLLVSCLINGTEGPTVGQFVLKAQSQNLQTCQIVAEAVATAWANVAELPCPAGALYTLTGDEASLLSSRLWHVSPGLCYLSTYITNNVIWSGAAKYLELDALRIFLFDYCLHNRDRLIYNPNLMVKDARLFAFDHEQTLDSVCRGGRWDDPGPFLSSGATSVHCCRQVARNWMNSASRQALRDQLSFLLDPVGATFVEELRNICSPFDTQSFDWHRLVKRIEDLKQNVSTHVEALYDNLQ